ncbi:hypothetical protein BDW74DRAFT_176625 [Aspergillus multicolor]|uniref:uncharacterized protein n=1 Tax=Aspergillus multicolor TaxID=41759 RepID=UPI003CCCDC0F
MHLSLPTFIAALAAASPNPNPKAPKAPSGADNNPAEDIRDDPSRQHSVRILLQSEPYLVIESYINIQLEYQVLNKKEFPNGVMGIEIPEGYHCRFWEVEPS